MLYRQQEFKSAPSASPETMRAVPSEFGGMMPGLLGAIYIDTRMQAVRRAMAGLTKLVSNASTYEGVGVRMSRDGEKGCVELCHRDKTLILPLSEWLEPELVARVWQLWSRRLRLPMLLIQNDESTTIIRKAPDIARVRARRYGSPTRKRRTRFQVTRRPGQRGEMPVYREAREVMSWE